MAPIYINPLPENVQKDQDTTNSTIFRNEQQEQTKTEIAHAVIYMLPIKVLK